MFGLIKKSSIEHQLQAADERGYKRAERTYIQKLEHDLAIAHHEHEIKLAEKAAECTSYKRLLANNNKKIDNMQKAYLRGMHASKVTERILKEVEMTYIDAMENHGRTISSFMQIKDEFEAEQTKMKQLEDIDRQVLELPPTPKTNSKGIK